MECSINIGNFTVNSISNNANINFEATVQNSHTANSIFIGACLNFGDHCSFSCSPQITRSNLVVNQTPSG